MIDPNATKLGLTIKMPSNFDGKETKETPAPKTVATSAPVAARATLNVRTGWSVAEPEPVKAPSKEPTPDAYEGKAGPPPVEAYMNNPFALFTVAGQKYTPVQMKPKLFSRTEVVEVPFFCKRCNKIWAWSCREHIKDAEYKVILRHSPQADAESEPAARRVKKQKKVSVETPVEAKPTPLLSNATFADRAAIVLSISENATLIPVPPRSKATTVGTTKRSRDVQQISKWNTRDAAQNCGVVASYDEGGLWFMDDDLGILAETILKETGQDITKYFRVKTADGFHYYFLHDELSRAVRYGKNENSDVIDVPGYKGEARCNNQYVLSPLSVHPTGHVYQIVNNVPLTAAPGWLLEWLKAKHALSESIKKENKKNKTASQPTAAADSSVASGFKKLAKAVGWAPLARRMQVNTTTLVPGVVVPCPMPNHKHKDYTNCFGVVKNNPGLVNCLGNCGFSGDVTKAVYEMDGGATKYPTMFDAARAICAEEGLKYDDIFSPSAAPSKQLTPNQRTMDLIPMSATKPKHVKWLWKNRILENKGNVLFGEPGLGKGFIGTDFIARMTTGKDFYDGPNKNVIYDAIVCCDEDSWEETIQPRLMVAGADESRVFKLLIQYSEDAKTVEEGLMRLDTDLPTLATIIGSHPDRRFIILIDPLATYVGDKDPNKDKEVRPLYTKITQFCEKYGVTVIFIAHPNKNEEASAINRLAGAKALTSVFRNTWLVERDSENKGSVLMVSVKGNLASEEAKSGLRFHIENVANTGIVADDGEMIEDIGRLVWDGETEQTADDVLSAAAGGGKDFKRKKAEADATAELRAFLANGARPSSEWYERAAELDLSDHLTRKAKGILKVKYRRIYDVFYLASSNADLDAKKRELDSRLDSGQKAKPPIPDKTPIIRFKPK